MARLVSWSSPRTIPSASMDSTRPRSLGRFAGHNPPEVSGPGLADQFRSRCSGSRMPLRRFHSPPPRRIPKARCLSITDHVLGRPANTRSSSSGTWERSPARSKLIVPADAELTNSWQSTAFGEKHALADAARSPPLRITAASRNPHRSQSLSRCNTTLRRCGLTRCSNRYTPCQVPSASLPW